MSGLGLPFVALFLLNEKLYGHFLSLLFRVIIKIIYFLSILIRLKRNIIQKKPEVK